MNRFWKQKQCLLLVLKKILTHTFVNPLIQELKGMYRFFASRGWSKIEFIKAVFTTDITFRLKYHSVLVAGPWAALPTCFFLTIVLACSEDPTAAHIPFPKNCRAGLPQQVSSFLFSATVPSDADSGEISQVILFEPLQVECHRQVRSLLKLQWFPLVEGSSKLCRPIPFCHWGHISCTNKNVQLLEISVHSPQILQHWSWKTVRICHRIPIPFVPPLSLLHVHILLSLHHHNEVPEISYPWG